MTTRVKLAYGRDGLWVDLPDHTQVIAPRWVPGLPDEDEALRAALRRPIESPPLAGLVGRGQSVVIVHSDITRATPNDRILPVLLAELEAAGVRREDVTLLNGLGTHRPQTVTELRAMLSDAVVDNYRCLQHNAWDDDNLVTLGETALGHPVCVNRTYLNADVKILTGFIEPHLFAGFSGGPKAVLPSLAGAESVLANHGHKMIANPNSTWGVTQGNPIWEEMCEVALRTEPSFLLNVALNAEREITGVFAGEMLAAHAAGCDFVRRSAMVPIERPFDVVLTTNSGYPLDLNLFQSVKGVSAAAQIVRQGGAILLAAACEEGLPDHRRYAELLAEAGSPQAVLDMVAQRGFSEHDQWQAQIQAQIQLKADVHVHSGGLTEEQIRRALFEPAPSVEETIAALLERYGSEATVCALPEGPQTIAYPTVGKQVGS